MDVLQQIEVLEKFVSAHRINRIAKVLNERTRHLSVVLEDIYHAQNASAVLRTCECFGIQDVHFIENRNHLELSPGVVLGSNSWLTLHRYNRIENNTDICLKQLRKEGYKIMATSVSPEAVPISEIDVADKLAFVFGTELTGISKHVESEADALVRIPMYGFTDSFNLSVSAGIIISGLIEKMRKDEINWQLSDDEKVHLRLEWLKNMVRRSDLILAAHS